MKIYMPVKFSNRHFDIELLLKENQIPALLELNLPHPSYGTGVISWPLGIGRQLDQLMWEHTEQMRCAQIHFPMLVLWNPLIWAQSWAVCLAPILNGVGMNPPALEHDISELRLLSSLQSSVWH